VRPFEPRHDPFPAWLDGEGYLSYRYVIVARRVAELFICAGAGGQSWMSTIPFEDPPVRIERGPASHVRRDTRPAPFLSIVTRTQGLRPHTLVEMLTSLAAQTDTDFELLILGHKLGPDARLAVDAAVADSPVWLRGKIRRIDLDEGNRTRPLNIGFANASGEYVSILDDDDTVFAHWVETFHQLARENPGRVLRTLAVVQTVDSVSILNLRGLRAEGSPMASYPVDFDFIAHLRFNGSPGMTLAFPRCLFHEFALTFDESLTTTEDWDFLMRSVSAVGIAGSPTITAVYRWWATGASSRTAHRRAEWLSNQHRVWMIWDSQHLRLPSGSIARIVRLLEENEAFRSELRRLRHLGITVDVDPALLGPAERLGPDGALTQVRDILNSTSWRVSAPLRRLAQVLGRDRGLDMLDLTSITPDEADAVMIRLLNSTSWRITAPLRSFMVRRRRKRIQNMYGQ
jgi:hypothetical protein